MWFSAASFLGVNLMKPRVQWNSLWNGLRFIVQVFRFAGGSVTSTGTDINRWISCWYCQSKKSWPILCSKLLYTLIQRSLDLLIHTVRYYVNWVKTSLNFVEILMEIGMRRANKYIFGARRGLVQSWQEKHFY